MLNVDVKKCKQDEKVNNVCPHQLGNFWLFLDIHTRFITCERLTERPFTEFRIHFQRFSGHEITHILVVIKVSIYLEVIRRAYTVLNDFRFL